MIGTGCEKECEVNDNPGVEISFYQDDFSKRFSRPFHEVYGMGPDVQISQDPEDNTYFLPLSLNQKEVSFVFRLEDERDTITFTCERTSHIDKDGCGFYMQFKNLEVRHSTFDSIRRPIDYSDEPVDNQFKLEISR